MVEIIVPVLAFAIMVVLAIVTLWIRDRIFDRPLSAEQQEEQRRELEQRLRQPDWSFVAGAFGGTVPPPIRALYTDEKLILSKDLKFDTEEVACFVPADARAFDPEQWFDPAEDAFVFATTVFGDPFFVRTSEVETGLPVYLLYHDGGDMETISASLGEFVERLRDAATSLDPLHTR